MRILLGDRPTRMTAIEEDCIEAWKRGDRFTLETQRLTPVRLLLEDEDVTALFYALIERYQNDGRHMEVLQISAEVLTRLAPACQQAVVGIGDKSAQPTREEEF